MAKESVFTPEELEVTGQRTLDLLQDAIDAGDKESAGKLAQRMYSEFSAMHDLYRDWRRALRFLFE